MSLLFSDEIKIKLADELTSATSHLHIVSAYCKEEAMKFIQCNISVALCKKLLVRFSFNDIVSGATDLSIYEFCKKHGWQANINLKEGLSKLRVYMERS